MDTQIKILVVEDEPSLKKAIIIKLKKEGFFVIDTNNGKEAISIIKKQKPDFVLLDLMLPEMSGEQVLEEMNRIEIIKNIPVLVLTAKSDQASINNCVDVLGARDFIIKSDVMLDDVIKKVRKILKTNKNG